jgi:hypothetical protein
MSFWIKFSLLIAILLAFVVSCAPEERKEPSYTRNGVVRDTIYSVDHRGNNIVLIWLTHSDVDAFCFADQDKVDLAENLLREHDGEVVIEFESQISYDSVPSPLDPKKLCRRSELSNTVTVYLGRSLKAVNGRGGR